MSTTNDDRRRILDADPAVHLPALKHWLSHNVATGNLKGVAEEFRRPDAGGDKEGDDERNGEVDPWNVGAKQRREGQLCHVGAVGADHDHLAMRHVDDSH